MIPKKTREKLEKQHYGLVGEHSAVQICRWTKKSLRDEGDCWKGKFYGIKSHKCCQFSPAVMWCDNMCLHCWRPIEMNLGNKLKSSESPKEIIDRIIKTRRKLLIGFKSNKKTSKKKFEDALEPEVFTFSLSGEPTLYPKLPEMIKELRKRKKITFLVTNGLHPEMIKKLEKEKSLPTQLTVSCNAPNKKLFEIWHRSSRKEAWKKFNETLSLLKKLKVKTRRVVRLTLVRKGKSELSNMENENVKEYAKLILKAEPDFVHVKGFKSLGYSRERLGYDKQPYYEEILDFAKKLVRELKGNGYKILGKDELSCVAVLGKDKKMMKIGKV